MSVIKETKKEIKLLPQTNKLAYSYGLAFLCGTAVMVLEIGGARALAPFFGSSLPVWTAQITATLLFLALGYALGGALTQRLNNWALPTLLLPAGLWLAFYAILRQLILDLAFQKCGIVLGSFFASTILFGIPLAGLGGVGPVLIDSLRLQRAPGSLAGLIFFISTMGNLAGGWLTALLLIPYFSLKWSILFLGVILILLACLWAWRNALLSKPKLLVFPLLAVVSLLISRGSLGSANPHPELQILYSSQSSVGLIQVLDLEKKKRCLLLDGVMQGGIWTDTGFSFLPFSDYLNYFAQQSAPMAKNALLLGLGCGVLANNLVAGGIEVTAVDLEPKIEEVDRAYFKLSEQVKIVLSDARAFLFSSKQRFDLIVLDSFAGENMPFYLTTIECMELIKNHLNPGGKLLVNLVTRLKGQSTGLQRLETVLRRVFKNGNVYVEPTSESGTGLVNGILLAGGETSAAAPAFSCPMVPENMKKCLDLKVTERPIRDWGIALSDDRSDLDYADSSLKLEWRRILLNGMDSSILDE